MANIMDCIKESMDGKQFESMVEFKLYLASLTNSMIDEVYEAERSINKLEPKELESSMGVIIDF